MKRILATLVCVILAAELAAPAAASVNVNRNGDENPMQEVAKSVFWGGLAGLTIGGALALASDKNDNDGDLIRYGFVTGTFVGLGVGMMWILKRPQPTAALELKDGALRASLPSPTFGADGRPRVVMMRVRF